MAVSGDQPAPEEHNHVDLLYAGPGYFRTVQIPVLAGREFEDRDRNFANRVALINESMMRHYFKGRSPLGETVTLGDAPPVEIVGVVADSRSLNLRERAADAVYQPTFGYTIVARVKPGVGAEAAAGELGAAIAAVTKTVPATVSTLDDGIRKSLRRDELVARLSAALGLAGAILAFIGLYGAISQTVTGRTREIGIRIALGAEPSRVVAIVSGQVLRVIGAGVLVGLPLTIDGGRLVEPMLFEVSPADPGILSAAALLLAGVGLLAGLVPARRAARLDPTLALRHE